MSCGETSLVHKFLLWQSCAEQLPYHGREWKEKTLGRIRGEKRTFPKRNRKNAIFLLTNGRRCDIITKSEVKPRREIWPVGQAVKTEASHAFNIGSIPVRVTKL